MATQNEDTDPSTPSSIRSQNGDEVFAMPVDAPVRPTTSPGLGPKLPAPPSPSSVRPMGVVVPAPSATGPNAVTPCDFMQNPYTRRAGAPSLQKDSVELLLDGVSWPRPDRTKTTPQSGGEASASYHARHGVRPPHTLSEVAAKVVVARAPGCGDPSLASVADSSLHSAQLLRGEATFVAETVS
ncbi:MAG: hypothetical protein ACREJ3_17575, partial [Polyangiaceae bacterium]